ncbi:hypothetical protein GF367_01340 [Candidatus Woesearchaeota archaeon]|nr:hypothetical protein [Candidatus Woesearchaeota archaeon]
MRGALFLSLSLLLLLSCAAAEPYEFASLVIDGSLTNPVMIVEEGKRASISSLTANISWFPRERPGQDVLFFTTVPDAEVGDRSVTFSLTKPMLGAHSFDIEYQVETAADVVEVVLPVTFPLPPVSPDLVTYLHPTETIDINDDISSLAADIVGGEDDLFKAVVSLALWTKQHIGYDLSTVNVEASQPSSWVLENRRGVCDELTNLFISFCRSLGIPARFVSGLAYTNAEDFEEGWGAHGWAEVYFPGAGWVPFDVTYGQLGWVDASHVVFAQGVDSGKYASSYSWLGRDVQVDVVGMQLAASLVSEGELLNPLLTLDVRPLMPGVGFGSYQLVEVEISNPTDRYVADELQLALVDGFSMVDPAHQAVALAPGESTEAYWRVLVDEGLDAGYLYTYPLIVQSVRGARAESSFTVVTAARKLSLSWVDRFKEDLVAGESSPYDEHVSFSCEVVGGVAPRPRESIPFMCSLMNDGGLSLDAVEVCLESSCETVDVAAGASASVSFSHVFAEPSLYALSFSASHSLVESYSFVSLEVVEEPVVRIENVSAPASLDYAAAGIVHFEVVHAAGVPPRDVMVTLRGPRMRNTWEFAEFTGVKVFDITLAGNALSLDDDAFTLGVSYRDDRGARRSVVESFNVALADVTWWQRVLLWLESFW